MRRSPNGITFTLSLLEARAAGLQPHDAEGLTLEAYAELSGISLWTAYRWRSDAPERLPPAVVVGGRIFIPMSVLVHWRTPVPPNLRGKCSHKGAALAAIDAARKGAPPTNSANQ